MLPMRLALLVTLALATAGCGAMEQTRGLVPRRTTAYRQVVSANDRLRLRDWRTAFVDGLAAARKAGHGAEIDREGALLDPDAAQTNPAIPNGMYRCRVIKLGAQGPGNLDFVEYPGFKKQLSFSVEFFNTLVAMIGITALYVSMLYLILHRLSVGFALLGTTLICVIVLYFTWYKTLPPPAKPSSEDEQNYLEQSDELGSVEEAA